jgi:hypothetical protein
MSLGESVSGSSCPNCGHFISSDAQFCPGCGQKSRSPLISFKELLGDFFDSVFNVNSKFFGTLKWLFVPGFLTREFFSGKHVRYFNPLRLFFVTLVAMYTVLGLTYLRQLEDTMSEEDAYQSYKTQKQAELQVNTAIAQIGYDTLTTREQNLLDSLVAVIENAPDVPQPSMTIDVPGDSTIVLSPEEVYDVEIDSVLRKYKITSFWGRLISKQLIKAQRDPVKAVQSLIGNTSWMILLLMPALAIWMKLLYIRRRRYFVEHVVFLFHYHAAVFVALILYIPLLEQMPVWIALSVPALLFGFLYFALLRYYGQNWFKTLVKLGLLSMAYMTILFTFSLLTLAISLLLFQ